MTRRGRVQSALAVDMIVLICNHVRWTATSETMRKLTEVVPVPLIATLARSLTSPLPIVVWRKVREVQRGDVLRVRRSLDVRERGVRHERGNVAPDARELGHGAVVHEDMAPKGERVVVELVHRAGRHADVREDASGGRVHDK